MHPSTESRPSLIQRAELRERVSAKLLLLSKLIGENGSSSVWSRSVRGMAEYLGADEAIFGMRWMNRLRIKRQIPAK